jgi:LuxR family maltose regulon positive regulatory protein
VCAGRDSPPLRVARLRAEGRIVEIGPAELSLTPEEAAMLLRAAEVTLGEQDVAELHRRTEGWAAGLYLAALYLREGGSLPRAAASFGGSDRFVSDYVESEFLERISGPQRAFLTQTAALERMCGPLCNAVLDRPDGAATLADLARSNLLLVPLDRQGEWPPARSSSREAPRIVREREATIHRWPPNDAAGGNGYRPDPKAPDPRSPPGVPATSDRAVNGGQPWSLAGKPIHPPT